MTRYLLIAAFALIGLSASPAHAGILEFLFPSLRDEGYNPSETLQAPFAAPAEGEATAEGPEGAEVEKKDSRPEDAVPLKQAHRASADISEWVTNAASEVMTFDGEYKQELADSRKYFDEGGRAQYEAFLNDTKIKRVLESGKYEVRSYVSDVPLLLNEGAVKERYRWLYEVPVMVSYIPKGSNNYKNLEPVNQAVVIRLQVGRTADAETDLRLKIERWNGKAAKAEK